MKTRTSTTLVAILLLVSIGIVSLTLLTCSDFDISSCRFSSPDVYRQQNTKPPDRPERQRHRKDIINGIPTQSIEDYPYTVSLLDKKGGKIWHSCGGCLITPNVVLTAAHCKDYVKIALMGHHYTKQKKDGSLTEEQFTEKLTVIDHIMHPQYDSMTQSNDFLLLKLPGWHTETPFINLNYNRNVPNTYASSKEKELMVLGWGLTQRGNYNSGSEVLMRAKLYYINNFQCAIPYGFQRIKRNMMCAHSSRGRDACQSDSGGPLIMQHADGPEQDTLVGIVSWGKSCGSQYPGVYGRVSSAYSWINRAVCDELSPESCNRKGFIRVNKVKPKTTTPPVDKESKPQPITKLGLELPTVDATKSNPSTLPQNNPETIAPLLLPLEIDVFSCEDSDVEFDISNNMKPDIKKCSSWIKNEPAKFKRWYRCRKFKDKCKRSCGFCST